MKAATAGGIPFAWSSVKLGLRRMDSLVTSRSVAELSAIGRNCPGSRPDTLRCERLLINRLGGICQQLIGGKHLGASLPVEPSYWQIAAAIAGENKKSDGTRDGLSCCDSQNLKSRRELIRSLASKVSSAFRMSLHLQAVNLAERSQKPIYANRQRKKKQTIATAVLSSYHSWHTREKNLQVFEEESCPFQPSVPTASSSCFVSTKCGRF